MDNTAICVLGMHRSGTSALTGALRLAGVELSNMLIPGKPGENERGHWEHEHIVEAHEGLLNALGSSWDDIRPLPDNWWTDQVVAPYRRQIIDILRRNFSDIPLWGIKDPRICRLLPLWLDVFDDLGCKTYFVLTFRHPYEVVLSLEKRDGFARTKAALLWLNHNLKAEKYTRGHSRRFTNYDRLLNDPHKEVNAIITSAGAMSSKFVNIETGDVQRFVESRLRHHVATEAQQHMDMGRYTPLVTATYTALEAAYASDGAHQAIEFDTARRDYEDLVATFDSALLGHISDLHRRLQAYQVRIDNAAGELQDVLESSSWRITYPLRKAKRQLRELLGVMK